MEWVLDPEPKNHLTTSSSQKIMRNFKVRTFTASYTGIFYSKTSVLCKQFNSRNTLKRTKNAPKKLKSISSTYHKKYKNEPKVYCSWSTQKYIHSKCQSLRNSRRRTRKEGYELWDYLVMGREGDDLSQRFSGKGDLPLLCSRHIIFVKVVRFIWLYFL